MNFKRFLRRIGTPAAIGSSLRPLLTWPFLLLAAVIVALTLAGMRYTFHQQKDKEIARFQAIADLKVSQIAAWFEERHGDAQLLHGSRFLADLYQRWRSAGDPAIRDPRSAIRDPRSAIREQLRQWLDEHRQVDRYQNALLFDEQGEPALMAIDAPLRVTPELRATVQRAIAEGRVLNTGLYRSGDDPGMLSLDFVAPLPALSGQAGPAVVLRVDPKAALYPMIQSWPFPSASAETVLFRHDGDQALFLSPLRHQPDAALQLRLPVAESRLLAAQILRGDVAPDSVVEGVDYRQASAMGVGKAIPGTDWFLLAKLDRNELYAPALRDAVWIALIGVIALLAAAVATILIHQRQRQARQVESLQQLANERHRLRMLIQTIPDLVWLKDPDGVYLACNLTFERFFGAQEADIIGKTDYDFVAAELADFFRQKDQEALAAVGPSANEEWVTFAADGHRARLQTIKTPMRDIEGKLIGVLGIGRDITVLHQAEQEIRRLSDLYATLSQINQAIVRINNRQELLDEVCRVTAHYGGFRLAWVGWIDPQTRQVRPVAQAGAAVAYLDEIVVYADDRPEGCGLVGTCLREGQPCIFNNLLDDPRSALWRERARQYGLQAAVGIPIRLQGEVCAAFAVYAATPDVFQAQEMNLLEEAAGDISFALDHLETERQRQLTEEKLRESEVRLKSIFRALPAGIGLIRRRVILEVNDALCRMTGYAQQELLGQSARLLYLSDQDYDWVGQEKYRQIAEKGTGSVKVRWRRKDGDVIWVVLNSTPLDVADLDKGVTFTALDITDHQRAEDQIVLLTYYDALTQLPNRVLLTDRLQQGMAQTQRDQKKLAVCYLDLDDFKPINDRLGPVEGDRVLVEVAHRLKACVRAGDTVARLGGDEFVLLLGELSSVEECERALDRVFTALQTPFAAAGPSLSLTASLGVTLYPDDASDPDALLRHTDQAMYAAKQAGGHRYHWFDADHDRRARAHHDLLQRVETGLAADEFCLYYQPKVDMRTGAVIGVEALIRWQHPEEGLLPPVRFMPAVETSELVTTLDCWVIQEALRQMTVWAVQGLNLPVSVNVCGRHLQQPDFVARLQTVLARYPTTPRDGLELEILETAALDDMAAISRLIEACRQFGVRFALDDFGTGYSSLTYLQHLPVQVLKIDQSFVRNLLVDADARAIVEGVIGLSAAFRREVIAEGVETDAHGCRLIQLGCVLAQGYGIARPMPPEQIPAWIAGWAPPGAWVGEIAPERDFVIPAKADIPFFSG